MKIVFFCNGVRGDLCFNALVRRHFEIVAVVVHPAANGETAEFARTHGLPVFSPEDPNDPSFRDVLARFGADVFVLAGYGKIFREPLISLPRKMTINLHGGTLPQFRGSSPMNWALIKGESSFSISVIKVDPGVDTGDVLEERSFAIVDTDTIRDLHRKANEAFPQMVVQVLDQLDKGTFHLKKQDPDTAAYYPLRFPDDGLILWDIYTAREIHDRIRALTDPYPCAFTYVHGKKVLLTESALTATPFYGEPGRVYRKTDKGVLVCASDRSLWITKARVADTQENAFDLIQRYDVLPTVRGAAAKEFLQ